MNIEEHERVTTIREEKSVDAATLGETGVADERTPAATDVSVAWRDSVETAQRAHDAHVIKTMQIIWLATAALEFLFAMRFFLKLLDANPSAGFAVFVYNVSAVFLFPFMGLTSTPSAGGAIFEISTLIAMVVYAIVGWLLVRLVRVVFGNPPAHERISVHSVRRIETGDEVP